MAQRIWRHGGDGETRYTSIDGPELTVDEYEVEILRLIQDMAKNTTMRYLYWFPSHCQHWNFTLALQRLVEQGFLTESHGPWNHVDYRFTGKLWDSVR